MITDTGLTLEEVSKRKKIYGENRLVVLKKTHPLSLFISQFTSPLVLILLAVAIISWLTGYLPGVESNPIDAFLIVFIVFLSGIAGYIQEYKSEKTIQALQDMSVPQTVVIRAGRRKKITIDQLVPGDIVLLESGDIVPADAQIIEGVDVMTDESILTGESSAVGKEIKDMVYMNTYITSGSAKAVVVKTGMHTKVGKIAQSLQKIRDEKTPFQKEIDQFSRSISIVILILLIVIFVISLFKYSLYVSILTAVSLAVAAIPEGLPAVVVLTLAAGAKVMFSKHALIRKLSVTESVGSVDIICTDKTGTLTQNEMKVTKIFIPEREQSSLSFKTVFKKSNKAFAPLLLCGALCNNAYREKDEKGFSYMGDQTEIAIRKLSDRYGYIRENLEKKYTRVRELSFTSKRKLMSVVYHHGDNSSYTMYTKGAPEIVLAQCSHVLKNGKKIKLTKKIRNVILEKNKLFSSQALRVIAFAKKDCDNATSVSEKNLTFLGLEAMMDPPRSGVKEALSVCSEAGIRIIMLTGDNPETAQAIAEKICLQGNGVITGDELDRLSDQKLAHILFSGVNIYARISPFHKLKILKLLQEKYRVAMTGDGVNDALALKKADAGIAMGIRGTEVAKQASDMILLDDNFATIASAVKEGRRIFDNIQKFINYLFVSNFAEIGVLFLATLFVSLKEPILLPIQLLWINLLTDGAPALALGIDPARPDIMKHPPRKKGQPLITNRLWWLIGTIGIEKILILLGTFFLLLPKGEIYARSALFTGFILYEFVRIASIRYQEKLGWFSNPWLLISLVLSVGAQILVLYTPVRTLFHVVPLGVFEWVILISGMMIGYIGAIGITHLVVRMVKED